MPASAKMETSKEVARPVPILPVPKSRGSKADPQQPHLGAIHKNRRPAPPDWSKEDVTYQNTGPALNSDRRREPPPPTASPPPGSFPKDTDTMVKTKTILNEHKKE